MPERKDLQGVTDLGSLSAVDIDSIAKHQAEKFANRIKTNQIRNIYGAINQIRNKMRTTRDLNTVINKIVLLKPKLAYAAGKKQEGKEGKEEVKLLKDLKDFFTEAINAVINAKDKNRALENFFILSEAIVCYHKFFEETQ